MRTRIDSLSFEVLADALDDLVFITDPNGDVIHVNPSAARMLGRPAAAIVGRPQAEVFPEAIATRHALAIRHVCQTGEPLLRESQDFAGHWLETRLVPLRSPGGTVDAVLGIARDVTTRKRAETLERARQEDQTLLRQAAEAFVGLETTAAVYEYVGRLFQDLSGADYLVLTEWDSVARRVCIRGLFGLDEMPESVVSLLGADPRETAFPIDAMSPESLHLLSSHTLAPVPGGLHALTAGRFPRAACERVEQALGLRSLHVIGFSWRGQASGSVVFLNRATTINNAALIEALAGQVAVVLQRRRAEDALRESERRYRITVENAGVGIANVGLDGRFLGANQRFLDMFGHTDAELQRATLPDLTHPDERAASASLTQALVDGRRESYVLQKRFLRRDGGLLWGNATVSLVRSDAGQPAYLVAVVEDITERRRLEERLAQSQKLEAIGQLAGGVAHDFNNQLTAITGYADLLARSAQEPKQRLHAERILESARRSAALTRQLLAFARKGEFKITPVNIHALIDNVVAVLERSIDRRVVVRKILRAPRATVEGDPSLLENALLNLALNSRDAMPEGGLIELQTDVVEVARRGAEGHPAELAPGEYLRISVVDTGCGMNADVLGRLFEPFFTTKEPGHGTGLGLAAVFGTVKRHAGAIAAESAPGRGSTFRVYLPLGERNVSEPEEAARRSPAGRRARILVVDDEALVRDLAQELLQEMGHSVATAADGRVAVTLYKERWREIDLVILDLVMPELSGTDAFAALQSINPAVRVLVSSGFSEEGEAVTLLEGGARGFLPKPFTSAQLGDLVERALSGPPRGGDGAGRP